MLYHSGGDNSIITLIYYMDWDKPARSLQPHHTQHTCLISMHVHSTAAEFISCYTDSPDVLACTNIDSIVTKVHPVYHGNF